GGKIRKRTVAVPARQRIADQRGVLRLIVGDVGAILAEGNEWHGNLFGDLVADLVVRAAATVTSASPNCDRCRPVTRITEWAMCSSGLLLFATSMLASARVESRADCRPVRRGPYEGD